MSLKPGESPSEPWIEIVRQRVQNMRFGTVQIVVHEGRVTQVESTEKTRLPADESSDTSSSRTTRRS